MATSKRLGGLRAPRRWWDARTSDRGSSSGFSLLEVVIALVILMLVLVPIGYVLADSINQSANARQKTTALGIAEQWIETLNNTGPPPNAQGLPNVGNSIAEGTQVASNVTYTVNAKFTWAAVNGTVNLCTSGTVPQALDLQVAVSWGASNSVTDTTLINYPPASVPTNGFIGVQVIGDPSGTGNPEPADVAGEAWGGTVNSRVTKVPVTATLGSNTYTAYPDGNGCAFMEVPPTSGTPYSVQVGPETLTTAFAESGAAAGPIATTASVTTNNVTSLGPYLYDEGATVNLAFPNITAAENGVTCLNVGQIQCVATGQAPSNPSNPNASPVATVDVLSGSTWTSTTLPNSVSQIESTACASLCFGVGYGPNGGGYQGAAVIAPPSSPTSYSVSTLPAGVTNLTQIVCPSATTCLAIGTSTSSAVILAATISGSTVTWATDSLPAGVTTLSEIACSGTTACLAIGKGSAGAPVIVAGSAIGSAQTFVLDTLPPGVASLTQVVCSGTTACLAIGTGSTGAPVVVAGGVNPTTETFVSDGVPGGVTTVNQIVCAGTTACMAIGDTSAGGAVLSGVVSASAQNFVADTLSGVSLAQIVCSGTAACLASGSTSSGPTILSGAVSASAPNFVADTLPAGTATLSQIVCSGTTACLAIGSTSSGATILSGAVSASAETFVSDTLPSGVEYLSGIDCFTGGSSTTCAAPGATETGSVLLSLVNVTSGAQTWTSNAVSGVGGMEMANLPVSVNNTALGTSFVACASGTCGSSIGPLFPFASGYSVGAGDCPAEVANASAVVATKPGASGALAATANLPLGLLPIEVTDPSGNPVSGATVTANVADPNLPANSACNDGVTYSLPTSGPDGMTSVAAMFETYTVTATLGASSVSVTVQVTPTEAIETIPPSTTPSIVPLPGPVVVAL